MKKSKIHYICCILQSLHKVIQQSFCSVFSAAVFTVIVLWQTEIAGVMRQGMDELLRYEKKPEQKRKVYTYEKAVER